jgi:hypothetical protein
MDWHESGWGGESNRDEVSQGREVGKDMASDGWGSRSGEDREELVKGSRFETGRKAGEVDAGLQVAPEPGAVTQAA